MNFLTIDRGIATPDNLKNTVCLYVDYWNDFSFVTMFFLEFYDNQGTSYSIGQVKIGFINQTTDDSTYREISSPFKKLPGKFFSLGVDYKYYQNLYLLNEEDRNNILISLNDMTYDQNYITKAQNEDVFRTSLLRGVSLADIKGQFERVLKGGTVLTDYNFIFKKQSTGETSVQLDFNVSPESKPNTNIHAIIGRNGVGKTTILNEMITDITGPIKNNFYIPDYFNSSPIPNDYFSSVVSVSFSAFDPFDPPKQQANPALGTCYYYIGLKNNSKDTSSLKSIDELRTEFISSLIFCLNDKNRQERWKKAIKTLESDDNFKEMNLIYYLSEDPSVIDNNEEKTRRAQNLIKRMSSGHTVVLLTITLLVATVSEKTLILMDEPEGHLHPPLLSAFIRALSELLYNRNGIAIVATHSPVVLQEIPKSCVYKISRSGEVIKAYRPNIETFGENVGTLTREIFGLEVIKSGFHNVLQESVDKGDSFEKIISTFNDQLGFEAQAILRAMINSRDNQKL